jgi:hypothetical protein
MRETVFNLPHLLPTDDIRLLAQSPAKMKLHALLANNTNYCATLLIAGPAAEANARAEKAVREAIKACLPSLPGQNIPFVKVDPALPDERMFFKELGVVTGKEPVCAVVFGKGRIVAPLLKGDDITAEQIGEMFTFLQTNASDCTPDAVYLPGSVMDMIFPWSDKLDKQVYEAIAKSGVVPDLVWTEADFDPETGELIEAPKKP